jgi:DNA-binding MarR family transcriptional regulator
MDPARIDPELLRATRDCACLAARKQARSLTRLFDARLRPHGLRSTQFSVLAALAQTGPIMLRDLADLLGLERSTLTRGAAILEERGLVETVPGEDARKRPLIITRAGGALLARALPDWQRAQQEVAALSPSDIGPMDRNALD